MLKEKEVRKNGFGVVSFEDVRIGELFRSMETRQWYRKIQKNYVIPLDGKDVTAVRVHPYHDCAIRK